MRFGYVLLGLVTLAFLHVSSGEHSVIIVFGRAHYSSSTAKPLGGGGNRRRSRCKLNAMARIASLGTLAGDLATTDIKARQHCS